MYKFITIKNSFFNNSLPIRTVEISNYEKYLKFIEEQEQVSITHDINWSFIEDKKDFEIIVSINNNKIRGSIFIYVLKIPFSQKTILYSPAGPLISSYENKEKVLNDLFVGIEKLAQRENAILFHTEPNIVSNEEWEHLIKKFNINTTNNKNNIMAKIDFKNTTLCDLFNSLETDTTKSLLTMKQHINIKEGNIQDLQNFYKILLKQNKEQKIKTKPFYFYYNILTNANPIKDNVKLYVAECNSNIIAGSIITIYNKQAECLVSASDSTNKYIKDANLLLTWEILEYIWDNGIDNYIIKTTEREMLSLKKIKMEEHHLLNDWEIIFQPYEYIYYKILKKCIK